jgi:hypothetical protein
LKRLELKEGKGRDGETLAREKVIKTLTDGTPAAVMRNTTSKIRIFGQFK